MNLITSIFLISAIMSPGDVVHHLSTFLQSERDEKSVTRIIRENIDVKEIARRAIKDASRGVPEGKIREYEKLFTELFVKSSVRKFVGKKGARIKQLPASRTGNGKTSVKTIVYWKGERTEIEYLLHLIYGRWKIYDILIDGTSITENFRSEFSRIVKKHGFDYLLEKLREKLKSLEGERGE